MSIRGKDRLIVALDFSTAEETLAFVRRLGDAVTFFKVGWQLFIAGEWLQVVRDLRDRKFFVDLKVPGDIDNTIAGLVTTCVGLECVQFITLSEYVKVTAVRAAREARGASESPAFLVVPLLSSIGEAEFRETHGTDITMNDYMLARSKTLMDAGCDGLIASGEQIKLLRQTYPEATIVSPGIRPAGSVQDDHKRFTTPAQAIESGADYLVVGRPIRNSPDPSAAARRIIDEIDEAQGRLGSPPRPSGSTGRSGYSQHSMNMRSSR